MLGFVLSDPYAFVAFFVEGRTTARSSHRTDDMKVWVEWMGLAAAD